MQIRKFALALERAVLLTARHQLSGGEIPWCCQQTFRKPHVADRTYMAKSKPMKPVGLFIGLPIEKQRPSNPPESSQYVRVLKQQVRQLTHPQLEASITHPTASSSAPNPLWADLRQPCPFAKPLVRVGQWTAGAPDMEVVIAPSQPTPLHKHFRSGPRISSSSVSS